jgi:hypothetical protein
MGSGRTRPLLLGCENEEGENFEVVVKFRSRELSEKGQIAELVSAMLADDLGLQSAGAGVVDVPTGFESVIPDASLSSMVAASSGLNFGSVHVGAGFTTWLPGRTPHGAQRDQAVDIFAFDVLIQNPDRRALTPNLWVRSDRLGVFDHEQAFSFLSVPIIGGAPRPWEAASQTNGFNFLKDHIFYGVLRGGQLNLGPFGQKLAELSDHVIQRYIDNVPAEWRSENDFCKKLSEYLSEARQHREKLVSFVKHILR